ncbi:MAG TPA: amino acid adenylation domain-containing protein [Planctomycetota bacterium]|nr:amino acid adenylation domain-containing protein [Planctomycetota bacterium]
MPQSATTAFQISPAQARLLSIQARTGLPFESECRILIEGALDTAHLKTALHALTTRHEILRTTFERHSGVPLQVIHDEAAPAWNEIDLHDCPVEQQSAALEKALEQHRRPIDAEHRPVLHATLAVLGSERHVLQLRLPVLCADGPSLQLITQELASLYSPGSGDLPEPPQYADYAAWQQDLLAATDDASQDAKGWWEQQKSGSLPEIVLPFEKAAPLVHTNPKRHLACIPNELSEKLESWARDQDATLNDVFLAAWQTVLSRLSQQQQIELQVSIDPRAQAQLQNAVGLFEATVPLVTTLDPEAIGFSELLSTNRKALGDAALRHTHAPHGTRENSFAFACFEADAEFEAGAASFTLSDLYAYTSPAKLRLCCQRLNGSWRVELQFTERYSPAQAEMYAGNFLSLLQSLAEKPGRRLHLHEITGERERTRLVREMNQTQAEYSQGRSIHSLFEEQAARTPDRTAIVAAGRQMTYAELNARANQIARCLRKSGVRADVPVGLCCERTVDLMAGLLGILKAGGAYVPLIPEHPSQRLLLQLNEAKTPVLLTQGNLLEKFADFTGECICLDSDAGRFDSFKTTDIEPQPRSAESLAYIIFTSGSTGTPKGVAVTHRSLVNYTQFIYRRLRLHEPEHEHGLHFASVSSIAADLGNTCVYPALISGGTLHLISYEAALDAQVFAAYLHKNPIDVLKITPSNLNALLGTTHGAAVLPRRFLLLGGEASSWQLVKQIQSLSSCELLNHYGPTETTVGSLTYNVDRIDMPAGGQTSRAASATLPIGRPMANTEVYILDRSMNVVPLGTPGELYIGGLGLARGYYRRPGLTADRFVPDPFSGRSGARLYRTGDLVRYLEDGAIEFLGRVDNQVKIRGFRIELEEIEAVLSKHDNVRQGVVVAREDAGGQKRLVAYVILKNAAAGLAEVKAHLQTQLPEYMIPSTFEILEALPLTPNGKVDKKALPEPRELSSDASRDYVAPRNTIEQTLTKIFAEVLNLEKVSISDSFFELGGHSLLATKVMSRLREQLKIELSLRALLDHPTASALSQWISQSSTAKAEAFLPPPITHLPNRDEIPASYTQQGIWFYEQFSPTRFNLRKSVHLRGELKYDALQKALNVLAERHEILRTVITMKDGIPFQRVLAPAKVPLCTHDLSSLGSAEREAEVKRLQDEAVRKRVDLAVGPLFRASLLKLQDDEHLLVLCIHHVLTDGWSHEIMFNDLARLYDAFSNGKTSPLPELPIQFGDFSEWQRKWLQGAVLERLNSYWMKQLEGELPVLRLPFAKSAPQERTDRCERHVLQLSPELSSELAALGQREGATLFMTVLAGLNALLHRYTGQTDFCVGSPVAGRTRPETEALIGPFINVLTLRTKMSPKMSFRELLKTVRDTALGALAHQDMPLAKLVEEVRRRTGLGRSDLFQIMLLVPQKALPEVKLPGVSFKSQRSTAGLATNDLILQMIETDAGLEATLEYNTDLFDSVSTQLMLRHFEVLLHSIVAAPDQELAALPMLTSDERTALLHEYNATSAEFPEKACLHQLFEARARATPDHPAVMAADMTLSYGELERSANRWARELRHAGMRPNTLNAVVMEKGWEQVVAVLAIHKAGGAYLPLDPELPQERLHYLLAHGEVKVVLTTAELDRRLSWPENVKRFVIDREPAQTDVSPLDPVQKSSDLAYVIYTSGSTGLPKGVVIAHRGAVNTCVDCNRRYSITPKDRVLALSSLSFDLSVYDIFGTLAAGATIVMPETADVKDPGRLARLVSDRGVTVWNSVPALMQMTMDYVERQRAALPSLRMVLMSGDWIPVALPQRVWDATGGAEIYSMGGATEASIWSIVYPIKKVEAGWKSIPYGRPMANQKFFVLNESLEPCPVGITGDLYIGGIGLAEGYWRDAEKTEASFIMHPRMYERLYRTGDLGRFMPDGDIEFLGRRDFQVKVNGYRIELGEIEAALEQHEGVRHGVVNAFGPVHSRQLIAYTVPRQTPEPAPEDLRKFLAAKLPQYMVPVLFVSLTELPLSSNGKVNRAALPLPQLSGPEESASNAPASPLEQVLAAIVCEVLHTERAGVRDSLFALGANSLSIIQLVSRLRDTLEVDVSVPAIFERPSIAGIAELIGRNAEDLRRAMETAELFMKLRAEAERAS